MDVAVSCFFGLFGGSFLDVFVYMKVVKSTTRRTFRYVIFDNLDNLPYI